ncbi:MAG TPA: hypothetical protein VGC30_02465, partial [Dokdonella sp.]
SACFVSTRPATALRLELWSPPQLAAGQQLRARLGGAGFTQALRPGVLTPVLLPLRAAAGTRVELAIEAERSWRPTSADPAVGDRRDLVCRIVGAELVH